MSDPRLSAPPEPPPPLLYRLGGLFLVLHGLAHAAGGRLAVDDLGSLLFDMLRVGDATREGVFTLLWLVAMVGLMAAGFGWLGAGPGRRWPRPFAYTGACASLLLFALRGRPFFGLEVLIDVIVLVALVLSEPGRSTAPTRDVPRWRPRGALGHAVDVMVALALVYVAAVVAMHAGQRRWGATEADLVRELPGDGLMASDSPRPIHHAVTIRAPAPIVWSYVVQLGQDRGGFYSYSGLENLLGLRMLNADRVHPEWQQRRVGDFVPSAPAGWMGGAFGPRVGWEVAEVVPGHALVLRWWGAFVVDPAGPGSSRLLIRTHVADSPLLLAPLDLFLFEPIHFVMERRMLLTIRDLAERDARAGMAQRGAG